MATSVRLAIFIAILFILIVFMLGIIFIESYNATNFVKKDLECPKEAIVVIRKPDESSSNSNFPSPPPPPPPQPSNSNFSSSSYQPYSSSSSSQVPQQPSNSYTSASSQVPPNSNFSSNNYTSASSSSSQVPPNGNSSSNNNYTSSSSSQVPSNSNFSSNNYTSSSSSSQVPSNDISQNNNYIASSSSSPNFSSNNFVADPKSENAAPTNKADSVIVTTTKSDTRSVASPVVSSVAVPSSSVAVAAAPPLVSGFGVPSSSVAVAAPPLVSGFGVPSSVAVAAPPLVSGFGVPSSSVAVAAPPLVSGFGLSSSVGVAVAAPPQLVSGFPSLVSLQSSMISSPNNPFLGMSASDLVHFPNKLHSNLSITAVGPQADISTIIAALRNQGTYPDVQRTPFGLSELKVLNQATAFLWQRDPDSNSYVFRAPTGAGLQGRWRISYNTTLNAWVLSNDITRPVNKGQENDSWMMRQSSSPSKTKQPENNNDLSRPPSLRMSLTRRPGHR